MNKVFIGCMLSLLSLILPLTVAAYTMSSSNYRIDSDSVNSGGNTYSTSSNYSVGDSIGEIGTGYSSSTSYKLAAGWWTPADTYIALSTTGNVSLGSISGFIGGTATSSASYNVTTNNGLGYQLIVQASTSPALKSPNSSIPDYAPGTSDPDFSFTIASSTAAAFGFSPEGSDIVQKYKDNGSACNIGSSDTKYSCWDGFSTSQKVVAQSSGPNEPSGATTTIQYEVKIGASKLQESSPAYTANITITAVTL